MTTYRYALVIEDAGRNLSAYLPDVPGCVTTGRDERHIRTRMAEALAFHFEGMARDGEPIPMPTTPIVGPYVKVEIRQIFTATAHT